MAYEVERFKWYLYYWWHMKSIQSQQAPKKGTFSKAQAHHKLLFTPIACTKLSYVDLEWEDFSSFRDLMQND